MVAYDVSRGAERYARALVDILNSRDLDGHLLITLFESDEQSLGADFALDVRRGLMRRVGLDPRVVVRMRRLVADLRPVSVVAHGGESAKYVALALNGKLPYAYVVIGSAHPLLANPLRRAMRRIYVGRAAALVAVSEGLVSEIKQEVGRSDRRIHLIPNGRDPDLYHPNPGSFVREPRVVFIGSLDDQKRPLLFIQTMRDVLDRGIVASAAIVGGGPLLDDVTAEASGFDVLGPRDDVPRILAEADLLVLTSRPPEGLPGVLIEAGLSGIPVVTTDVPGAREIVDHGVTGLVVGVDDRSGLADAIEILLKAPVLRRQMGRAARERCLSSFSIQSSADMWESLLLGMKV